MTSTAESDTDATVTPLPDAAAVAADAARSVDVDGARRVSGVHRAIDRLDVSDLGEGEHAAVLRDLERAKRRLDSALLAVLASADRARVGERAGHTGTGSWASAQTKCGGGEGFAQSRLATDIDEGLGEVGRALAEGVISSDHARIIAATMRRLPEELSQEHRDAIEMHLVGQARHLVPSQLRKVARRALEAAERSLREIDDDEDEQLRDEERRALARTRLTMRDNGDGTSSGHFTVPTHACSMLRKLIQQIASPRRDRARQARGEPCEGSEDATTTYGATDWAHRYGLALLEILEHLPTDRLHGKVAATVVATVDLEALRAGIGAAQLDTGDVVSAGQARRLACNAGILPVVLGGSSLPLDLGRADRFFTEAQRVALATVYTECAAVGCDRPYSWCELHHEDPWSAGGQTDLDVAVPLCGYHHRRMHDPGFVARVSTDGAGVKTVRLRQR
ncbi:DUF222 domain-containing protein [Nostocoides sp. F2B08]|uniref:HNH endonuclease signature motif containing protein n=1 Tax=Nostocoides sp. F2B08 TaxID=2653936 RepID=UPI0012630625|nr:HNH endonuclease signature motif containing protein [Tetrasphaera sp. F2B08]KAB7744121.1 DUF222 domain-containing protein [Tetrasphaera sp. F2B08]